MMCAVGWVVPHVYMRVGRAGTGNGQVHLMCVLDLVLRGYLLQLVIRTRARLLDRVIRAVAHYNSAEVRNMNWEGDSITQPSRQTDLVSKQLLSNCFFPVLLYS